MSKQTLLRFTRGNAKLDESIAILSLPAGHTCPGARECLTKAARASGKISDGPEQVYRCYAATQEVVFDNARKLRWANFMALTAARTREAMRDLIVKSVEAFGMIHHRVHGAGDFFNAAYFNAWMDAAGILEDRKFYAYTKSLDYWLACSLSPDGGIPRNFKLVASYGGRHDDLIKRFDPVTSRVVMHPDDAAALHLDIDHDDSHAMKAEEDFALLLHGNQRAGTVGSKAKKRMREEGIEFSYSK